MMHFYIKKIEFFNSNRFKSAGLLDEGSRIKAKELLRKKIRAVMEENASKASAPRAEAAQENPQEQGARKYNLWDNLSDSEDEAEETVTPVTPTLAVSESRV